MKEKDRRDDIRINKVLFAQFAKCGEQFSTLHAYSTKYGSALSLSRGVMLYTLAFNLRLMECMCVNILSLPLCVCVCVFV